MTKEFLLHKDKEKETHRTFRHICLCPTKANASQSQKSLHFTNAPNSTHHPKENY